MAKSFWTILQWICLVIFLLYVYLKWIGVLQSPIAADTIGIISLGYVAGAMVQKVDHTSDQIKKIGQDLKDHITNTTIHK
jgi:hypothetical protein